MTSSTSIPLMNAVAIMTDWRLVRTFACEVVLHDLQTQHAQVFDLHAEPMHSSYTLTERVTGREQSYDDATRTLATEGQTKQRQPNDLLTDPVPVRLAFPLSLPIWGRRHDTYWMADARQQGRTLAVHLVGKEDATLSGALTIDLELGLAVRIDAPTLQLEYRGIVPARSRFGFTRD